MSYLDELESAIWDREAQIKSKIELLHQRLIDRHVRQPYLESGGAVTGFDEFAKAMRDRLKYCEDSDTVRVLGADGQFSDESISDLISAAKQAPEFADYFAPAPPSNNGPVSAWQALEQMRSGKG